ncbi:MAG: hypothetical protein GEU73_00630 [Chloroflexi bacterium]|nr:hypothetical protein [Chloroflexota bacterium]
MQVAHTLKIEYRNARIKVDGRFFREGSILAGTARAVCDSVTTEVHLESDEPPVRVAELIRMAEASCYTIAAIRNAAPVSLVSTLNGAPLEVDAPAGA